MFHVTKIKKTGFEIDSQGCRLRGFILRPEKAGRLPAVIVSHGFIFSGFAQSKRATMEYLRSNH